jgi:general secretion pathway protein I
MMVVSLFSCRKDAGDAPGRGEIRDAPGLARPAMNLRMPGFTLLETLVALAVIGIAMAAAMRSTRFAIDTVADLKARTAAGWVAQNLAGELRATRAFPEMGATSGRAVQGRQEFLWRQEVGGTPNYSFRRVEIKVFLPEQPEHAVARRIVYVARQQN